MKMNQEMVRLLAKFDLTESGMFPEPAPQLSFVLKDGSVFLEDQYAEAKNVSPADFPDRTGFESFVNHVHFPFDGDKASLQRVLGYAFALQAALESTEPSRKFLVIVSVSEARCTVRFHECRPNESWLADDLEGYKQEALLVLSA